MGSVKSKKATPYIRRAHHAGSWYDSNPDQLDATLSRFLSDAVSNNTNTTTDANVPPADGVLRGLVVPHAGYSYSGPTAAYAYQALVEALSQRSNTSTIIVVLHPSHHAYLNGCAVSGASTLETPLGDLPVSGELRDELLQGISSSSISFTTMDASTDEAEHSGELQYPYIAKACRDASVPLEHVQVLPIMVGAIDTSLEEAYGKWLGPILARPHILTLVSSDFCHWGRRFRYQPTSANQHDDNNDHVNNHIQNNNHVNNHIQNNKIKNGIVANKPIFLHVEEMDRTGMKHIEMQEPGAFATYLKQTSNTICGRHAISVWLHAIQTNREANLETLNVTFVRYAQSSKVTGMNDSSVSYASGVARLATTTTTTTTK